MPPAHGDNLPSSLPQATGPPGDTNLPATGTRQPATLPSDTAAPALQTPEAAATPPPATSPREDETERSDPHKKAVAETSQHKTQGGPNTAAKGKKGKGKGKKGKGKKGNTTHPPTHPAT